MLSFLRQHAFALLCSFVLHAALAAVLAFSVVRHPQMTDATPAQVAIEATVVDSTRIEEEMQRLEAAEQAELREREAEAERLREEAAKARQAQEEEARRLAELREQRAAELEAEQKRQQEAEVQRQRAAEVEVEQMAEALRQREEAKQRQEELRRQQEEERERLEELERRRKEEEERLARLEEERRAAEEARARTEREAALRAEIEAEQQLSALRASPMAEQYHRLLEQSIQRQWIKPPSAQAGIQCTVHVTQIPSGDVVGVRVGTCNADDAVIRSIEAAVHRASPLPKPPDPQLFERNLELVFAPDQ